MTFKSFSSTRRNRWVLLGLAALAFRPSALEAQQAPPAAERRPSPITFEARVDAIFARVDALHAGVGATIPLGNYVRAGVVTAAGFSREGRSARIDVIARFHLDPFRESRWAPYGGGGVTTRYDQGRNAHTYLMLLAGVDGPAAPGVGLAVEAALGGGGRLGIILRRTRPERR